MNEYTTSQVLILTDREINFDEILFYQQLIFQQEQVKYQKDSIELADRSETNPHYGVDRSEQPRVDQKTYLRKALFVALLVIFLSGSGLILATALFTTDETSGQV